MPADRKANVREYFPSGFARSIIMGMVGGQGKGCLRLSTLSGGTFGMHDSGPGGRVRGTLFDFALSPLKDAGGLTIRGGVFSMHARGSVARARRTFCFAPLIVQFVMSRGRGLGTPVAFYSRWGRFSMYISA